MSGLSPIAQLVAGRRRSTVTTRVPWGIVLHTTGRGVGDKAIKKRVLAASIALDIYLASQKGANGYPWGGPGYLIADDGVIYQLAEDTTRTQHVGGANRQVYLSGEWQTKVSRVALARWHAEWGPKYKNPQQLFPSKFANTDYVGVEMIPAVGASSHRRGKTLFTEEAHMAAVRLCIDIARRNAFPTEWWKTSRLVGHEDVGLLDRSDRGGGWDPGFLREEPYFDFDFVRAEIGRRW